MTPRLPTSSYEQRKGCSKLQSIVGQHAAGKLERGGEAQVDAAGTDMSDRVASTGSLPANNRAVLTP